MKRNKKEKLQEKEQKIAHNGQKKQKQIADGKKKKKKVVVEVFFD